MKLKSLTLTKPPYIRVALLIKRNIYRLTLDIRQNLLANISLAEHLTRNKLIGVEVNKIN